MIDNGLISYAAATLLENGSIFYIIVAFWIGLLFTLLEKCTSVYPNTCGFLLKKSWMLWGYCIIYGVISAIFMFFALYFFTPSNPSSIVPNSIDSLIHNPLIQAISIGISVKAIMHINVFSANLGTQSVPIGLETITLLFEPYLFSQVALEEYSFLMEYIGKFCGRFSDVKDVKEYIKRNVPHRSDDEWKVFLVDLDKRDTIQESLELYFRKFGKRNFDRIFSRYKNT